MTLIPEKSTYNNDLDLDTVREVMLKLQEAWKIAADGGVNISVKHGDNDEADGISYIISQIQRKYQDKATTEQRLSWRVVLVKNSDQDHQNLTAGFVT